MEETPNSQPFTSDLFCKNAHNMATTLPFAKEECQDNTRNRTDSQHDHLAFHQLPRASVISPYLSFITMC